MIQRNSAMVGALGLALTTLTAFAGTAEDQIRATFSKQFPTARIDHLVESPVPGLFEVGVGSRIFYVSADGRYLFNGKLIDIETRRDLSESYLSKVRREKLDAYDEADMIVFEPKKPAEHTVTVFTDIDCPYCRKLHEEIGQYSELGVRVRYMLYPRAGVKSHSYEKAVSVWCAKDRQQALTFAKGGGEPEELTCDNPVKEQMELGRELGLQGTPMIITDTGEQIMGYMPAKELAAQLRVSDTRSFQ